jgi:hypothetical protein
MKFRIASLLAPAALLFAAVTIVPGCGNSNPAPKLANVKAGAMPEGESWSGVYFHTLYGYLHLVDEGDNILARWRRADQSSWGELIGKRDGDLVRFDWVEHKVGLVGQAAESKGKGYFRYTSGENNIAELKGQFGLDGDEVGAEWNCKKQQRMTPDPKSITGDTGGVAPPAANVWK